MQIFLYTQVFLKLEHSATPTGGQQSSSTKSLSTERQRACNLCLADKMPRAPFIPVKQLTALQPAARSPTCVLDERANGWRAEK